MSILRSELTFSYLMEHVCICVYTCTLVSTYKANCCCIHLQDLVVNPILYTYWSFHLTVILFYFVYLFFFIVYTMFFFILYSIILCHFKHTIVVCVEHVFICKSSIALSHVHLIILVHSICDMARGALHNAFSFGIF